MQFIYFPFVHFCESKLKIYPPAGKECRCRGDLFYFELQQSHDEEWQALQGAAQYKFGCATWIPKDRPVASETCMTIQFFPNSRARRMYERNGNKTVNVHEQDVQRLNHLNQQADEILGQRQPSQ